MKKKNFIHHQEVREKLIELLEVLKAYRENHKSPEQYQQTRWRITAGMELEKYKDILPDLEYLATLRMTTKQKRSLSLDEALNRLADSDLQKLVNVASLFTKQAIEIHGASNSHDSENEATVHEVNLAIMKAFRGRL